MACESRHELPRSYTGRRKGLFWSLSSITRSSDSAPDEIGTRGSVKSCGSLQSIEKTSNTGRVHISRRPSRRDGLRNRSSKRVSVFGRFKKQGSVSYTTEESLSNLPFFCDHFSTFDGKDADNGQVKECDQEKEPHSLLHALGWKSERTVDISFYEDSYLDFATKPNAKSRKKQFFGLLRRKQAPRNRFRPLDSRRRKPIPSVHRNY